MPPGFAPLPGRGGDFIDASGPVYLRRDGNDAVFGLRLETRHCDPAGAAHVGTLVALVDELMGYVIWDVLQRRASAVSLNSDFLQPAKLGDWLEVRCTPTRVAIELIFVRGEASVNGERVMTASGVWKQLK
jgi:acyl-coenzyme A thioesterase PaaI-like protein